MIPTAWTDQTIAGVRAIEPRNPAVLANELRQALLHAMRDERPTVAVKVGMLPNHDAALAVVEALGHFAGPVVYDPVLVSSSGGALYTGDLVSLLAVGARSTLMTPNAIEAGAFTARDVQSVEQAIAAGRALAGRGVPAVLVKGGHLPETTGEQGATARGQQPDPVPRMVTDVLVRNGAVTRFDAAHVPGPPVRGTGCALATAIAVGLARGLPVAEAITEARRWLAVGLAGPVGRGAEWHLP